jgi:hypothetical protein
VARSFHTATLLSDGRVLVVGSADSGDPEIWDPVTGEFDSAGRLDEPRGGHTATLLPDGRVLVAGGIGLVSQAISAAEVFDAGTLAVPIADRSPMP